MTTKTEAIQDLQKEATRLLETAKNIEALIPDNLPEQVKVWGTDYDMRLSFPFNWITFRQVRRALGPNWKRGRSFTNDLTGDLFTVYKKDGVELTITMDADKSGAVCQREQIGVKEVPIYKVTCQ